MFKESVYGCVRVYACGCVCARVRVRVRARMGLYLCGCLCSCACLRMCMCMRMCVLILCILQFGFSERAIDFCICFGVNSFICFFLFILPNFICLLL